ncbi:MAG: hypothetical protein A2X49_13815 [Lentisphaerae bacterium GWF2_52_8]|nr:MAG: hypothetical protein A2X49_13815 [Lentisphaerae bacterium GWF2_52_8]
MKAKIFMSAGLMDYICPPSGVYAAYNNLKCPKEIINYQLPHGGAGPEPKEKIEVYLKEVKAGKAP